MIVRLSRGDFMTLKDMKYKLIVDGVTELFLKRGINVVTIKDVASFLGLGEATIYRYFSRKENLVTEIAIKLEEEIFNSYFKIDESLNGYDAVNKFYLSFLEVFINRKEFYRFIAEFDNFVLNKDCNLVEYEKKLAMYYDVYINSFNKGISDETIKKIDNIGDFYLTTTHALMGLCKKLASDDILIQDEKINKVNEIKMLIDIIMSSIKN